jgi:ankyrin repeat protein
LFISKQRTHFHQVKVPSEHVDASLTQAALGGYLGIVKMLVEKGGADVNAIEGGGSPLSAAADKGHRDMVIWLVEHGADVNSENATPLLFAACKGHVEIAKWLIKNGVDLHCYGGYVLSGAVYHGKTKAVEMLIENGVEVDAMVDGRTALALAVRENNEKMTSLLLKFGASPHATLVGLPLITLAIQSRYNDVAERLLRFGANANDDTRPLLDFTIRAGNLYLVKLLCQYGAWIFATHLCAAIDTCQWDIAYLLISCEITCK